MEIGMKFVTTTSDPLQRVTETVRANGSNIRTIRVQLAEAGFFLKCDHDVADVAVEGRAAGDVSWIDLETTGIDLSSYDGTSQDFEIRYTAGDVYGGLPLSDTNPMQTRVFNFLLTR